MHQFKQLSSLNDDEKLAFFQRCQDLLTKNQPESEFILTQKTSIKNYFLDLFLRYQGFAYCSENVALLINKKRYDSKEQAMGSYTENLFTPPDEDANCYTIDFVSAVMTPNLIEEVRPFFDKELKYISWLRNGKVSFYEFAHYKDLILKSFSPK